MFIENLTEENFLIQCAKHYRNKKCASTEEFLDDLKRFKYLKKILTRFASSGDIEERLVLNHIIILNNVFGPEFLLRCLFLKMLPQMEILKPFLIYLNLFRPLVQKVNSKDYDTDLIGMNYVIIQKLREFDKKIK